MINHQTEIGHSAGAIANRIRVRNPKAALRIIEDLTALTTELGAAVAHHIGCDSGDGWHCGITMAPLRPSGSSDVPEVQLSLDELLDIAFEASVPSAAIFANRYNAIVRDAAQAVAEAFDIAVVATTNTYETLYAPYAVFGPSFDSQPKPAEFHSQTSAQWRNASAYVDPTRHSVDAIRANRRDTLARRRRSSIWPMIEAKLSLRSHS